MAPLDSASRSRPSRIPRLCTLSPSRPAKGLSLTLTVMEMVGGSIGWAGRGSVTSMAHRGSATAGFGRAAMGAMWAARDLPPVDAEGGDRQARRRLAAFDTPGEQAAQEGVVLDQHGEHLEGLV